MKLLKEEEKVTCKRYFSVYIVISIIFLILAILFARFIIGRYRDGVSDTVNKSAEVVDELKE